jgi:hypothetical protein
MCHLAQAILGSIPTGEEGDLDQNAGSEEDVSLEVGGKQSRGIFVFAAEDVCQSWP